MNVTLTCRFTRGVQRVGAGGRARVVRRRALRALRRAALLAARARRRVQSGLAELYWRRWRRLYGTILNLIIIYNISPIQSTFGDKSIF